MARLGALLLVALICVSCARGTPSNPILPPGVSPTPFPQPPYVGIGRYSRIAEVTAPQMFGGVPFVTFTEVRQAANTTITHRDPPGFVYAVSGQHYISWGEGERHRDWLEGRAGWVEPDTEHLNPTSAETTWYFIAFRPISQRGTLMPYPTHRILFASPDLIALPAGKQLVHQLALIAMEPGGRTSSHSHSGTEAFYVMKGSVELALNNGTRTTLQAGDGASIKPGQVMQLQVLGDEPVEILTYFVTPEGAPWQTNLQTVP